LSALDVECSSANSPSPVDPENLADLRKCMLAEKGACGVSFHGDAISVEGVPRSLYPFRGQESPALLRWHSKPRRPGRPVEGGSCRMKQRAMITGIAGFAGSHLAETLLDAGNHVEGICLEGEPLNNLGQRVERIGLHRCDIRSLPGLTETLRKTRPNVIYHLAALSSVSQAESNPKQVLETNFGGTLSVLQAMREAARNCRLVYVSSSEVYGRVKPEENPVKERQPEAPVHFYGFTKLIAEKLALYYYRTHGIPVILLRPFNHIGPRQSPQFVCSSFARQVARIEKKEQKPVIQVGNLSAARDFTDVRDMVRAYRMAAEHCRTGLAYNIASGQGVTIRQILRLFLSFSGQQIRVKKKPSLVRKTEIPVITGDPGRFKRAAHWKPDFDLERTLRDIYQYWLEQ
jgi:GDP-4-dehydro-6-deoxy-D-mannose reductase